MPSCKLILAWPILGRQEMLGHLCELWDIPQLSCKLVTFIGNFQCWVIYCATSAKYNLLKG